MEKIFALSLIAPDFQLAGCWLLSDLDRPMKSNAFRVFSGVITVFFLSGFIPVNGAESAEAPVEVPIISSVEADRILEHAGQTVTVTGRIVRVGQSPEGGITFLNFSSQRGGFVAVIFRPNYDSFPDGAEVYLNKDVRVTGVIKPYQGTIPQMPIESPAQIEVVEVAG